MAKINYPSTRKEADRKQCPHCERMIAARGLAAHIRIAHQQKHEPATEPKERTTNEFYRIKITSKELLNMPAFYLEDKDMADKIMRGLTYLLGGKLQWEFEIVRPITNKQALERIQNAMNAISKS